MSLAMVERDDSRPAGYAIIRISDAAACKEDPRFRLRRDGSGLTWLGPKGWQADEALLEPEAVETEDGDLVLRLGPAIVNHLKEAPYTFAFPRAAIEQDVIWLAIPPLPVPNPAIAESVAATPNATATEPERAMGEAAIQHGPAGEAEQPRQDRSSAFSGVPLGSGWSTRSRRPAQMRLVPAVAGLLVLGVAAVLLLRSWNEPLEPQNSPIPPRDVPLASTDLASLSVPDVVARGLPPATVRSEAERRLRAGRMGEGLLLLEQAANLGNTAAMAELAQAYDPATPAFETLRKDARQAAHYYRDAERGGDASVAPRRDALRLALEQRATSGETEARLVLRQFWP